MQIALSLLLGVGMLGVGGAHAEPVRSAWERQVLEQSEQVLRAALGTAVATAKVHFVGKTPSDPCRQEGVVDRVQVDAPLRVSRRMRVLAVSRCSDEKEHVSAVWYSVDAQVQGWIATRDLSAGSVVRSTDWERRLIELPASTVKVLAPESSTLSGYRLRRDAKAGQLLSEQLVEVVPEISSGSEVTVRVQESGVLLQLPALALSDGRIGDTIRLKSRYSTEDFLGIVRAPGLVAVESGTRP